jgi:hypothetical protein
VTIVTAIDDNRGIILLKFGSRRKNGCHAPGQMPKGAQSLDKMICSEASTMNDAAHSSTVLRNRKRQRTPIP